MDRIPLVFFMASSLCFFHQVVSVKFVSESIESAVRTETNKLSDRLPDHIFPIHYDIFLRPYLGERYFDGNVSILFNVTEPTSTIILHTRGLVILYTKLYLAENKAAIPILSSYEYKELDYWITELSEPIDVGLYEMRLGFKSVFMGSQGFYQRKLLDYEIGENIWMAVAELEPAEARTVFPCFDEPALKATFKICIQHPHEYGFHALSNMDIEKVERHANFTVTIFNKSVKMSTYLLTVAITNFVNSTVEVDPKGIGSPFDLIVYSEPFYVDKTEYVAKIGKECTEFLIEYFKIPYPLPKLGMLGIGRRSVSSSALETWGLIIFEYSKLFHSSELNLIKIVAHEIAHSWFGNLVTMKWWNDVWLNEGFATFMALKVMQGIRPEANVDVKYWQPMIEASQAKDSLYSTQPIVKGTADTKNLLDLFDHAAYSKGAAFLRMLESFVGADKFRLAMSNYLERFAFGSAETSDLIKEIEKIVPEYDIKTFFHTWTEKPGFPIINVEKLNSGEYKLTQRRYLGNLTSEEDPSTWLVPITYVTDKEKTPKLFFFPAATKEAKLVLPNTNWIKLNWQQTGYFRVNYSRELWYELAQFYSDDSSALSDTERVNLFEDAVKFSEIHRLEYDVILELLKFFKHVRTGSIWDTAFEFLKDVLKSVSDAEIHALKKFVRSLIDIRLESNPSIFDEITRESFSFHEFACYVDYEPCAAMVKRRLEQARAEMFEPRRHIPQTLLVVGTRGLSAEFWHQILDIIYEKSSYYEFLGSTNNSTQLEYFLNKLLVLDDFYAGSFAAFVSSAAQTNFTVIWNYIQNNWEKINENPRYRLDSILEVILDYCRTDQHLAEAKALREKYISNCDEDQECVVFDNAEAIISNRMKRREEIRNFLKNNSLL